MKVLLEFLIFLYHMRKSDFLGVKVVKFGPPVIYHIIILLIAALF